MEPTVNTKTINTQCFPINSWLLIGGYGAGEWTEANMPLNVDRHQVYLLKGCSQGIAETGQIFLTDKHGQLKTIQKNKMLVKFWRTERRQLTKKDIKKRKAFEIVVRNIHNSLRYRYL